MSLRKRRGSDDEPKDNNAESVDDTDSVEMPSDEAEVLEDADDHTVGVDRDALAAAGAAVERARAATKRRVSPTRALAVLVLTVVAGAALWWTGRELTDRAQALIQDEATDIPVKPYVDVTLPPSVHFEDQSVNPASEVLLGFIVAANDQPCTPTWGTFYDMDGAARALDLDRRVARHAERGGTVGISFGGAANSELALACDDVDALAAAYRSVIDRYDATIIDLDIEGPALDDAASIQRRALAIAQFQSMPGPPAEVWLTLPVAPNGLTEQGIAVVDSMLAAEVELAGVNVMTMNYGDSRPSGQSMAEASIDALRATHRQLGAAYERVGRTLTDAELWAQVGATPMIGRNDTQGDRFELDDASELAAFAAGVDLGRLSYWSLNRDQTCGLREDGELASSVCSGVDQHDLEFMYRLGDVDEVDLDSWAEGEAAVIDADVVVHDDPLTSPYPVWKQRNVYEAGSKVVWRNEVYEAKWWADPGMMPGTPVDEPWDTPWRRLGPVLDGDREYIEEATSVEVVLPIWDAEDTYTDGARVIHDGNVYEAKWWSSGSEPLVRPADPFGHPWAYLGLAERVIDTEAPDGVKRWSPSLVYELGDEVSHRGQRFRALWWNTDVEPDPFPELIFDHPWELLGEE